MQRGYYWTRFNELMWRCTISMVDRGGWLDENWGETAE